MLIIGLYTLDYVLMFYIGQIQKAILAARGVSYCLDERNSIKHFSGCCEKEFFLNE